MATQRYISTSFWDDEWIRSLDPSEKFVYLYLMTNTLTNIAGVYKITIARICFDTGYNEDTIKKILDRFSESKKAYLYKGYMILPTWPKHQRWDVRPKIKQGIDSILKSLDKDIIKYLKKISYIYPIIPYQYDTNYSDSDIDTDIDSNTDIDKDKELDIEKEVKISTFDVYWSAYPVKVSKKKAQDIYFKLEKKNALPDIDTHIKIINKWKQTENWKDIKFIPHPTTWLNQERWNDEIPEIKKDIKKDPDNLGLMSKLMGGGK